MTDRINCTRCTIFFDSRAVYREQDLTAVAGTRARLCWNCTQKLLASGHIRRCPWCCEMHSRGHRAPGCRWVLPLEPLSCWSYEEAGAARAHGAYVRLWKRAKEARTAETELVGGPEPHAFYFGWREGYLTLAAWLRKTRRALHTRINLKAGVQTDYLGRKVLDGTPRRLLGRVRA